VESAAGSEAAVERRTSPVELLWDLVFVFAITQVTSLLAAHLTWAGLGRSLLVLALVWWAWSAFVWAANAEEQDATALRLVLLVAMVLAFVAGLAIPRAFGREATLFAASYASVRLLHLALYVHASRRGRASLSAIGGFALTVAAGMALLLAGSFVGGSTQDALWAVAVAIDYAGPALLTRERLRGLQEVAVAHFAERYGLFVLICLGESIVAIGLGASARPLTVAVVSAVALGILITVGLWWIYFDRSAALAEARLHDHEDPVLAASDAYSYLHLLIVAGIILFAVGVKLELRGVDGPLSDAARLALCGGVALYLLGHAAFRRRLLGALGVQELALAALLIVWWALSGSVAAWAVAGVTAALLGGLCVLETARARTL
jgi:low temperature requirement protein LtrA